MKPTGSLFIVGKPQIYQTANKGVIITIQELFDELRKEPDWTKEIEVMVGDDFIPVTRVVPNLLDINVLILKLKEEE